MTNEKSESRDGPTIRELYPTLTEKELREAEANFRRYLEIALGVYQEQRSVVPDFDSSPASSTMKERSKFSLKD